MSTTGPFATDDGGATTAVADLFTELFGQAGLDSIWLDLDGDQVPDTQISVYDPADASYDTSVADPFELSDPVSYPEVADDDGVADPIDQLPQEFDTWVSVSDAGDWPIYDVSALLPAQSVPYADWTAPGAHGYDPLSMTNFSVDAGPVVFNPASGDPYCAMDYASPELWYNMSPFDDGAGYWDPTYAVMPSQMDYSQWQPAPDGYSADGFADPYAMPGYSDLSMPYSYDSMPYTDYSTAYSVPGYDATSFTSWDSSSPTDISTSYFTDWTFDDQLSTAADNSQYWMTEYSDASTLANDYWQASVEASNAGDYTLAYDYNQLSLDTTSYAEDAWSYSNSAWDSVSTTDNGWSTLDS